MRETYFVLLANREAKEKERNETADRHNVERADEYA